MFRGPNGAGKGDKPRPIKDQEQFDNNWDAIFSKKNKPVEVDRRNRGTGGVYLISGFDKEEVMAKAKAIKEETDPYRSPMISGPNKNSQGEWVAEVQYYGLD